MNLPDIYFEPIWGELYAEKDIGTHHTFEYNSNNGKVYYSFIKRKIDLTIDSVFLYDIITPYGFSGPIVLETKNKSVLLIEFKEAFDIFCEQNNIITDSCRFNPWIKNHEDFSHMYQIVPSFTTLGIKLDVEDIFIKEFSSKKRNMVRKANSLGIQIHFDFEGNNISEFLKIYKNTILKNNITSYYNFNMEFLLKNFKILKNKIFITYAEYENQIISIAIFLKSDKFIHYHLAANDTNYNGIPANDLLLYEVALYGKKNDFKFLMLGGGGGNLNLHNYKKGFTKDTEFDFYKGRRVCNSVIYDKILSKCNKIDESYFPSYR